MVKKRILILDMENIMHTDKKKILIVDDERNMLTLLDAKLTGWGYTVHMARDGKEALKIVAEVYPDLIISDVMMPNMDGNQFLKEIRSQAFGKGIPFIIITARTQMKDYFEAIGVDDFIEKPFKFEELRRKIEKAFHTKEDQFESHKRVLVAGTNESVVESMSALLREDQQHTDLVTSAEQVVSKTIMFLPNVIILDVEFIGSVSSQEIVKILRQMPQFKNVPVLLYNFDELNSRKDVETIRQRDTQIAVAVNACLSQGATEYIGRFDKKIFISKVERYLGKGIIAIIDDQVITVKLLEKVLMRAGYKVLFAHDGKTGLELVRNVIPDIVILDIVMPGMDGYEVMRNLKTDNVTKNILVIMLTVKKEKKDTDNGLDLGADDYVTKPFHTRLLVKRIEQMIRNNRFGSLR